jgi:hypothetical protein
MNIRQEAERIIFEARNLREADAIPLIEMRLKQLFVKGQKSGLEEARQRVAAPLSSPV